MSEPFELSERGVQLRGNAMARAVLLSLGWKLEFSGLPSRQGVVIVYPHTSNWDFVLGMLTKWSIGIPVVFWGKASLFRIPLFGRWMRWIGGIPVQRDGPQGAVGDMLLRMRQAREQDRFLWLALSPEGTRSLTEGWRSGFYQVATGAQVPVGLVFLDYGRKRVGVQQFLMLSGDVAQDMAALARGFHGVRGLKPELAAPIQLKRN